MPIDAHLFQLYLIAAVVLVLIPGPDSLLVLSRSLFDGRRAGWITASGTVTGNVLHAALAAVGVSALIAASPWFFDALRVAGVSYLAWLGARSLHGAVRAWRRGGALAVTAPTPRSHRRAFTHAFTTNLLNPKVILFYLAFVPQFVTPATGSVATQTFLLGMVLAFMGLAYHLILAAAAAGAARWLVGNRAFRVALDGVAGLLFLGFAVRLFLTERKFA
ncbi:MAG: LysE family translocator [Inquilinaceae bacterium]